MKIVLDEKEQPRIVEVPVDADGQEIVVEKLEEVPSKKTTKDEGETAVVVSEEDKRTLPTFTDEEYVIASPVVLGFAFAEKLWLEFTVSGVKDITWNEGAYDSLVLEDNTKAIVKVSWFSPMDLFLLTFSRLSLSPTNITLQRVSTMSSKVRVRVSLQCCMVLQEPERPSQQRVFLSFSNAHCTWCLPANSVQIPALSKLSYKRSSTSRTPGEPSSSSTKPMSSSRSVPSKIFTAMHSSRSSYACWNTSKVFSS
jgi:hypothetical protein